MNTPTLVVDAFTGLRNKDDAQTVGIHGFTAADNLDINGNGVLSSRHGQTLLSATTYRGAYATPDGTRVYAITTTGALEDWATDAGPTITTGFVGYPYWCQVADVVFVGNDNQVWRIGADGQVQNNALTQPAPLAVAPVNGTLPAGQYRVVQVTVNAAGRESAPSPEAIITVDGTQDILVSGITGQRLYVCPADSKVFGWWRDTTETAAVYAGVADQLGEELLTLNLRPMPSGKCLAVHEGRLHAIAYDARTNISTLYRSLPGWWDLTDAVTDYKRIPGEVRALLSLKGGLVIGTDNRIFVLVGDELTRLADYGVAPGQAMTVDPTGTGWIWTQRGLCSALPFTEVTVPHHSPQIASWIGTAVLRQGGDMRLVATLSPFADPDNEQTAMARLNC